MKTRFSLAPVCCAAFATFTMGISGCGGDAGESVDHSTSSVTSGGRRGVDYSWARPSPSGLHADGYTFAARYLSHDTTGKNLSAGEAHALRAAGVDVVANWENDSTAALSGYGQGVADAKAAESEASSDGMPSGRPIYFSVDFDATPGDQAAIDDYFDGVASVIGRGRTGAYGGYYLIERLFDGGKIAYGWQTYAWSGGQWDARAQVRQIENGVTIAGGACDIDEAYAADFGQWGYASAPPAPPKPVVPTVIEAAFQANTGDLWTVGNAGERDWKLGMMEGTSPSIAALEGGGYEIAFQANTGDLWTVGTAGDKDWKLGMMAGSSPSIAALKGGGFEVAFEANTTDLWTVGDAGDKDWKLGMMRGTSPSIAGLAAGGFEVAFEANTADLWTAGDAGDKDWKLGMLEGTSPSIAALSGSGFEIAFQANTTDLWTVGNAGDKDWKLGMMPGTNPSITAFPGGGFQVAFEANTTDLWTVGSAGDKDWKLGMMKGTSPSISAVSASEFKVSFQANTGDLWSAGTGGTGNQKLGMLGGTSPSGT
jgi:hypothetical protein